MWFSSLYKAFVVQQYLPCTPSGLRYMSKRYFPNILNSNTLCFVPHAIEVGEYATKPGMIKAAMCLALSWRYKKIASLSVNCVVQVDAFHLPEIVVSNLY